MWKFGEGVSNTKAWKTQRAAKGLRNYTAFVTSFSVVGTIGDMPRCPTPASYILHF